MAQTAIQQLEGCIEALQKGALTKEQLRQVIDALRRGGAGQQDLLYLQAGQTSVASQVIGFSLVEGGEVVEQHPGDPWPYETVLEPRPRGDVQFPKWRVPMIPPPAGLQSFWRSGMDENYYD